MTSKRKIRFINIGHVMQASRILGDHVLDAMEWEELADWVDANLEPITFQPSLDREEP